MAMKELPAHLAHTPPWTGLALPPLQRLNTAETRRAVDARLPLALEVVLSDMPLPDRVLAQLIVTVGPAAMASASINPWMGEDLWLHLFDHLRGPGRALLVADRVLSDRMLHHVVHVARDATAGVLLGVLAQLSDDDLAALAGRPLPAKVLGKVAQVRDRRTRRRSERWRPLDGRGAATLGGPGQPAPGFRPTDRLEALPDVFDPALPSVTAAASGYLLGRLGDNLDAWAVLARLLEADFRGTWQALADAALAVALPAPAGR